MSPEFAKKLDFVSRHSASIRYPENTPEILRNYLLSEHESGRLDEEDLDILVWNIEQTASDKYIEMHGKGPLKQ